MKYLSLFSGIGTAEKGIEQAYMKQHKTIQIIWSIKDVLEVRPDLSDDQAEAVLVEAAEHHSPDVGINYSVLESIAEALYGEE